MIRFVNLGVLRDLKAFTTRDTKVDEGERDNEESCRENVRQGRAVLAVDQAHGELDGEQAKQRGELDHRIQRDRRSIFERIAHRVADNRGVVQRSAFLL